MSEHAHHPAVADDGDRQTWPAILRGLRCKCPRCGADKLYRRYLKIADRCSACGLDLTPHRADDLPAYVAITIVGHILVGALLHFQSVEQPTAPWVYLVILVPLALILPLLMLPSIKGAIVALQWARRLHGF